MFGETFWGYEEGSAVLRRPWWGFSRLLFIRFNCSRKLARRPEHKVHPVDSVGDRPVLNSIQAERNPRVPSVFSRSNGQRPMFTPLLSFSLWSFCVIAGRVKQACGIRSTLQANRPMSVVDKDGKWINPSVIPTPNLHSEAPAIFLCGYVAEVLFSLVSFIHAPLPNLKPLLPHVSRRRFDWYVCMCVYVTMSRLHSCVDQWPSTP